MSERPSKPNSKIPVYTWNGLVDMLAWWKRTFATGSPGGQPPFTRPTDLVNVRNDSATDLVVGHVLQLGDKATNDIGDANPPWLIGDKPGLHPRQIAVVLWPCPAKPEGADGTFVKAQTSGVCLAKINVGDAKHRRAYPVKDSHVLTSGWAGPAEIIWKPDSLSEQLCLVRLYSPNSVAYWGVTSSELTAAVYASGEVVPGSGTVDLWEKNELGKLVPTSGPASATVLNYAPETIASGLLVRLASDDDWQLAIVNQFCTDGFA